MNAYAGGVDAAVGVLVPCVTGGDTYEVVTEDVLDEYCKLVGRLLFCEACRRELLRSVDRVALESAVHADELLSLTLLSSE